MSSKNLSVLSVGEKSTIDPFQPNSLQTYRQGTRNIIGALEMFFNISQLILLLANKCQFDQNRFGGLDTRPRPRKYNHFQKLLFGFRGL